jgi:hypothetical protein
MVEYEDEKDDRRLNKLSKNDTMTLKDLSIFTAKLKTKFRKNVPYELNMFYSLK